jgi:CMP-N-acetylneuraminic acid synthetase
MGSNGVLTIIPAKGGSTRLKRKNIAEIDGKPLIAYPIENAKRSGLCERVIVSTEDREIAEIARKYGAEVPFIRPIELARDPATVSDVCLHALEKMDSDGNIFKTLIILLPTAPLCTHVDIIKAFNYFCVKRGHFLFSVTEFESPPYNALRFDEDGETLVSCFPESEFRHTKSTECPKALRSNGAIVIVDIDAFKINGSFWGVPLLAYEMPPERSIDIDTTFDLELARYFMQYNRKMNIK